MGLFSFGKNRRVLGVDIGSSSIKIIELEGQKGKPLLTNYASFDIGHYDDKPLGRSVNLLNTDIFIEALKVLIREAKVSTKNVGVTISYMKSFISLIEIPDIDESKIKDFMEYEQRKHIPLPLEQVVPSYFVIPRSLLDSSDSPIFEPQMLKKDVSKTKKVLLIAIIKDDLARYGKISKKANLVANLFELEVFSIIKSSIWIHKYPIMLMDIGAKHTKFYIVEHGIVIVSHQITQGGETITEVIANTQSIEFEVAEKQKREFGLNIEHEDTIKNVKFLLAGIFSETKKVISTFESRYKKNVGKVVICGGGGALKGIVAEAKLHIPIETELSNPFSKVKIPEVLESEAFNVGPQFAASLGIALKLLEKG